MFKRPETVRKRQAQEDNNTTLHGIDERSEAMIKSIPKKRGKLIKSRSDVEMNRITLSEIATDAHKTEGKR